MCYGGSVDRDAEALRALAHGSGRNRRCLSRRARRAREVSRTPMRWLGRYWWLRSRCHDRPTGAARAGGPGFGEENGRSWTTRGAWTSVDAYLGWSGCRDVYFKAGVQSDGSWKRCEMWVLEIKILLCWSSVDDEGCG